MTVGNGSDAPTVVKATPPDSDELDPPLDGMALDALARFTATKVYFNEQQVRRNGEALGVIHRLCKTLGDQQLEHHEDLRRLKAGVADLQLQMRNTNALNAKMVKLLESIDGKLTPQP